MTADGTVLEVNGIGKKYQGVVALEDVSFTVPSAHLLGVLGPNGAGKSTLFHIIAGHLRQDAGQVRFRGRRLDGLAPHARARLGLGIVFQRPALFANMTVAENVSVGYFSHTRTSLLEAGLRLPRHFIEERRVQAQTAALLREVDLSAYAEARVEALPGGLQRLVAVARSLALGPDLLMLDEPASGLTGGERDALMALIARIRQRGITTLLIEHDVGFVSALADSLIVLDRGRLIAQGSPDVVLSDPQVKDAYLGLPVG